jgi:uncharacterized protein YndB with AHSA1/START domain
MTSDSAGAWPSLVGSMRAAGGKADVRMEDTFDTGIEDLWSALTEPGRLARWIAQVEGDLRLGGEFQASFTSSWSGPGRVDVCEPPRRLLVTLYPGHEDETVIEAVLAPEGARTRLVVEERGLPAGEVADHGAGWQVHVEDLGAYLAGRTPGDFQARWAALVPAYRELRL